jgi:hypothetical protein
LVTGGRNIGQERRAYLESIRLSTDLDKIVVPAGEDGSVLQADSSTATGLKWVPHEPLAVSLNKKVDSIVNFLNSTTCGRRSKPIGIIAKIICKKFH